MKILILGGTVFLGRAIVEAGLAQGHEITLFNRGQSNSDLFPQLEKLKGDRLAGDLASVAGCHWDAVVDTCGYVPRVVRDAATQISTDHYTFISSISAYADNSSINQDESASLATMDDPTVEEVDGKTYGPLKVLCEEAAEEALPNKILVVRSGLIVGPNDRSDRFTYWPVRIAQGGEVLAPGDPSDPVQIIDVRDQAEWIIRMIEANVTGIFNVTGPATTLTMGDCLAECKTVANSDATFTWVSEEFLAEQEVGAYVEMPLWVPSENYAGFSRYNIDKAIASGLTFRSLADTIEATLDFHNSRSADYQLRAGLTANRETELLHGWHERGNA